MPDSKLLGNDEKTYLGRYTWDAIYAQKHVAVASGTLESIRLKCPDIIPQNRVGIYTDNAGELGVLLASSGLVATITGWNTIDISNINIISGTIYWLAVDSAYVASGGSVFGNDPGGISRAKAWPHANSFPNPAGTDWLVRTREFAIAGWGTVGGASVGLIGDGLVGNSVLIGGGLVG